MGRVAEESLVWEKNSTVFLFNYFQNINNQNKLKKPQDK